jgi:flagellar secretion chaperone FliS
MSHSAQDAYLEGRILSADPLELVRLLYQGCSDAVREARRCLAEGDIATRSRSVSKASEILTELIASLDRQRGGEIAERLALLYDYMQRRLIEAHLRQADEPLAEVLGLLMTLGEAWAGAQAQSRPSAVQPAAWLQMAPENDAVTAHAWSC